VQFWLVAGIVLLLDRITKYLVLLYMTTGQSIPVIEDIFHLTFVKNPGAAFGLFAYRTMFFILVAIVVAAVIIYFHLTLPPEKKLFRIGLGLQLGGALGNLIDRIQSGYVIDFFDFRVWPVFNIADMAILAGVAILACEILRDGGQAKSKEEERLENEYNKG
jgi:signal peptidase II